MNKDVKIALTIAFFCFVGMLMLTGWYVKLSQEYKEAGTKCMGYINVVVERCGCDLNAIIAEDQNALKCASGITQYCEGILQDKRG